MYIRIYITSIFIIIIKNLLFRYFSYNIRYHQEMLFKSIFYQKYVQNTLDSLIQVI